MEAVTVRGTLENDVAAGELVNMRLSSTACTVRVNGETVFSFDGIGDSEPAGEPLLGWIGFRSPGISTRDEVEIALSSAASYSVLGDYVIVLDSLCTGEPDALFVASVASHLPMFVSGILVLIAGLILLLIASVGYLIGVPKETGGLRFAFYVLIGGVWIFFCFDYITSVSYTPLDVYKRQAQATRRPAATRPEARRRARARRSTRGRQFPIPSPTSRRRWTPTSSSSAPVWPAARAPRRRPRRAAR